MKNMERKELINKYSVGNNSELELETEKIFEEIRQKNPNLYNEMKEGKKVGYCYGTTLAVANTLEDRSVTILLMLRQLPGRNYKSGHAAIKKDKFIFDTNTNLTYYYEDYIKRYNTEVFTEVPMMEYMLDEEEIKEINKRSRKGRKIRNIFRFKLPETEYKFKQFCKQRGGYMYVEDIPKEELR